MKRIRFIGALRVLVWVAFCGAWLTHSHAQVEAEAPELAAAPAAESKENPNKKKDGDDYYNFKFGPMLLRVDGVASVEYNDNINLAHTGRLDDIILTPGLNLKALYPITDTNTLNLDLGLGYENYMFHPAAGGNGLIVTPDSAFQFDVYTGDVKINFHDKFSVERDPLPFGSLSNIVSFERVENTVGVLVDWRLGDLIWSSGLDYYDFWATSDNYRYLDHTSEIFLQKLTFVLSSTLQVGVTGTYTLTNYAEQVENNSSGIELGPFIAMQLNDNLALNGAIGVDWTDYSNTGTNEDSENLETWFFSLGLNDRVSSQVMQSLTVGRDALAGITSNFTERYYAKYMLHWNFAEKWSVSPYLMYENLDDSDAAVSEKAQRYGAGFTLNYQLMERGALQFGYNYILKDTDEADAGYYQNQFKLNFQWQF